MEGILIVLDGPEGCGKSTQSKLLARAFRAGHHEVVETFQPGATKIGATIRQELLHRNVNLSAKQESLYFSFDRATHIANIVAPALEAGKVVICDRWASATWAYQGYAGGIGTDIVEFLTKLAVDDVEPDLAIILDIDPEISFQRKKSDKLDRIEMKSAEYHQAVRCGFIDYVVSHPGFALTIEADKTPRQVHEEIIRLVNNKFRLTLPTLV